VCVKKNKRAVISYPVICLAVMSECNENIFTCPSNDAALDMRQPTSNIPQCHPKGIFINIFQATGTAAASNTPTPTSQNAFNKHRVLSVGSLMFLLIRFICLDRNDFSLCGVFFIIIIKFVKMQISSPLFVVRQSCSSSRWQQKLEKKNCKKGEEWVWEWKWAKWVGGQAAISLTFLGSDIIRCLLALPHG